MAKYFVTSDVHSYYNELQDALKEAGFDKNNPEHIFIHCGDLLDRGEQPLQCLQFVNNLPKERKILVKGNHEDLLQFCLSSGNFSDRDIYNGTVDTVLELVTGKNREKIPVSYAELGYHGIFYELSFQVLEMSEYKEYMNSLVDYAEVGDYIFVHGWIPCKKGVAKLDQRDACYKFNPNWKKGNWSAARWINGMDAWRQGVSIPEKTIVCGHWHASYGHSKIHKQGVEFAREKDDIAIYDPFEDKGIIALDACTAISHKVNCVVLDTEE